MLYPGGQERMFLAALDVRGAHKAWGRRRSEVEGAWDALCRKARRARRHHRDQPRAVRRRVRPARSPRP